MSDSTSNNAINDSNTTKLSKESLIFIASGVLILSLFIAHCYNKPPVTSTSIGTENGSYPQLIQNLAKVKPLVQSYYAVYQHQNNLVYIRPKCTVADITALFFLHVAKSNDLTDFYNLDFSFADNGAIINDSCIAIRKNLGINNFSQAHFRTGQYIKEKGELWEVSYPVITTNDYQVILNYLANAKPLVQSYYSVYQYQTSLVYIRPKCIVADTTARFFLHIAKNNNLNDYRNLDFNFASNGTIINNTCIAIRKDMGINDINQSSFKTGQYVKGKPILWETQYPYLNVKQ